MARLRRAISKIKYKMMNETQRSDLLIDELRKAGASIGMNVDILNSTIDSGEAYLIEIGDNVTITNARILTHDASTKKELGFTKVGKVHIGSNVFVGMGATILPDTTIGSNVIIGAGTIVAKDIPDNSVAAGNPVKIICTYDEYMERSKLNTELLPCFDKLPSDLNEQEKKVLKEIGKGFIR